MRWPDVTRTVVKYLDASLDGVWVATRLPAGLGTHMPVVRVTQGPGADDTVTQDVAIDVESFCMSEGQMVDVALRAREAMELLRGRSINGVLIDTVRTTGTPMRVDYGDPNVWRSVATFRVQCRKS